ncbi:tetratricopeptide repeat protein [Nocardia vinacea]|uniref:tetratricopeptide repeat protein n=1 Tax=Nocardia vinacea TaxID=96468 RepID=UPI003430FF0C
MDSSGHRSRSPRPDHEATRRAVHAATANNPADPLRPVVTTTLRGDLSTFIGRDAELERILDAATSTGGVVSIHTVDGMPGVGKTALATRAAHLLADRFPDGRYFVDLHTHTPGLAPADPFNVLAILLTNLGIAPENVPDTLEGRRDLWQGRLTDKRVLVVLDDARDHTQLEPLLPTGPRCSALITSRRRLIALDGATSLSLGTLDSDDAVGLFCTLASRNADTADAAAVAEIVRLCGYLPLAIALLAGRLAHHPTWSIATVAANLGAAHDRLDELDTGHRAVRLAFMTSYEDLPPARQLLFRRLGLHPGPDLDHFAVAALADVPADEARRELEALYTDHLVDETAPGRYRLHDLLGEYARTLAEEEPLENRAPAFDRLVDYYQRTALAAVRHTHTTQAEPAVQSPRAAAPMVATYVSAAAWMRTERPNLLACLLSAASTRQLHHAIALTNALTSEVRLHGTWQLAIGVQRRTTIAPHTISDHSIEAFAVKDLGAVGFLADDYTTAADALHRLLAAAGDDLDILCRGSALRALARARYLAADFPAAIEVLRQALSLCCSIGLRAEQAAVCNTLGWVTHLTGDYPTAITLIQDGLTINQDIGNRAGVAAALNSLGWVRLLTGDHTAAFELLQQSHDIYREVGHRTTQAFIACTIGWLRYLTGDYTLAEQAALPALAIYRDIGNIAGEAFVLNHLGSLWGRIIGNYPAATDALQRALAIYRSVDNKPGEASALNNLGRIRALDGDIATGNDLIGHALQIYRTIGNQIGEADALSNLGWIRCLTDDYPTAHALLHQALATFRTAGHRTGEAETLNRIATLLARSGDLTEATATYGQALGLTLRINNSLEQAHALQGLADCHTRLGDPASACSELRKALTIYEDLGVPETHTAAASLEAILETIQ